MIFHAMFESIAFSATAATFLFIIRAELGHFYPDDEGGPDA